MTIPGVSMVVAMALIAAVGDFGRFPSAEKLVAYLGLHPRVRQSGGQPAYHGRITKQGNAHARGMLVEAAFTAALAPGPLHAFYSRIKTRRGFQIAVVATARKLATLAWTLDTRGEDYAFARPSLVAFKHRKLELTSGAPRRGAPWTRIRLQRQAATPRGTRTRRNRRTRLPIADLQLATSPAGRSEKNRIHPTRQE
ncbi:transposase [Arthrobacter sp. efr-133-R2A-63]|uniref:transposase n=1 Tax=Arthrobacter sp. efr-133-R2A-63 TaxID=3040278 RepID=UPI00254A664F|nr:transposase [Arthrobacter sp. efr-133-R2A-63]